MSELESDRIEPRGPYPYATRVACGVVRLVREASILWHFLR
ncbi:MAG TPA: hypothetical protein VJS42_08955 [Steroidobacteraceae bacterium]|nr:hypothetical protein [Steroidobacteraceae bacterium]